MTISAITLKVDMFLENYLATDRVRGMFFIRNMSWEWDIYEENMYWEKGILFVWLRKKLFVWLSKNYCGYVINMLEDT